MATYTFSTITEAQALAVTAADTLIIDTGPANETTVLFVAGEAGAPDRLTLQVGGRSVTFGSALTSATRTFANGSGTLFIGTGVGDGLVRGAGTNDALYGGAGDDSLDGNEGADLLQGNQGRDSLAGSGGDDIVYGGQDDDTIDLGETFNARGRNFGQGNRGHDTITGGRSDDDTLLGGQGNDVLGATGRGLGSAFNIYQQPFGGTGGGTDFLNGNLGDDLLFGGPGTDTLLGEDGHDGVFDRGGIGNVLDGAGGNDTVFAQDGEATLSGGLGDDVVAYAGGRYVLSLGEGDDTSFARSTSESDRATVDGGAGDDVIEGSRGGDSIAGGAGADTLRGRLGADTLAGGEGPDQFAFFGTDTFVTDSALDRILDWSRDDRLYFAFTDGDEPMGAATPQTYTEATAPDFDSALAFALSRFPSTPAQAAMGLWKYVAVQVGPDVIVFADTNPVLVGAVDSAIRLVGRSLDDIGVENFVGSTTSIVG